MPVSAARMTLYSDRAMTEPRVNCSAGMALGFLLRAVTPAERCDSLAAGIVTCSTVVPWHAATLSQSKKSWPLNVITPALLTHPKVANRKQDASDDLMGDLKG